MRAAAGVQRGLPAAADDSGGGRRDDGEVAPENTPEECFEGRPFALATFRRAQELLDDVGPYDVRVSRSQVAFRRRRGFAWLWVPGQWLARPGADVVLTIALGRHDPSPRFKEVAHPTRLHWMHHLEVHDLAELDDDVAAWLREAWQRAG